MADKALPLKPLVVQPSLQHFITMTGELVDLFDHRLQGVTQISRVMQNALLGDKWFYSMQADAAKPIFIQLNPNINEDCVAHWQSIASANWHASAALLAKRVPNALFIDIGSTTSDFTVIKHHEIQSTAFTDAARMQAQTLIYTGVVRTPLMSLGQTIAFNESITTFAAEHFATTADIYRLTGDLSEADDMADTADGAEKTIQASAKRLARMVGSDVSEHDLLAWQALAQAFKALQFKRLLAVASLHIEANLQDTYQVPVVIGAGVGRFLAKEIAQTLGLPFVEVSNGLKMPTTNSNNKNQIMPVDLMLLNTSLEAQVSACLPAVAVGMLGHAFLKRNTHESGTQHA